MLSEFALRLLGNLLQQHKTLGFRGVLLQRLPFPYVIAYLAGFVERVVGQQNALLMVSANRLSQLFLVVLQGVQVEPVLYPQVNELIGP